MNTTCCPHAAFGERGDYTANRQTHLRVWPNPAASPMQSMTARMRAESRRSLWVRHHTSTESSSITGPSWTRSESRATPTGSNAPAWPLRTRVSTGPGVFDQIRQATGLDDLDFRTQEDGTTTVQAGKYIQENVYSTIEADSLGNSKATINLDINENITARGSVGSDGNTTIGVFFEKDY